MKELFRKYLENRCSPDEVKLLLKEFDLDENEFSLRGLIQQHFDTDSTGITDSTQKSHYLIDESYSIVKSKIDIKEKRFTANAWFQYAAAAVFIIFLGTSTYYLFSKNDTAKYFAKEETTHVKEILPGGNKAILTLENGGQIILDTVSKGMITRQSGVQVIKSAEGKIEYLADLKKTDRTDYNTISTPIGGQYQLTLSDGTKIWLNAASSVRFPATFSERERKVFITGEVYFEVNPQFSQISQKKGRQKNVPFIVDVAGKGSVEVLGTHFNINSYTNEDAIKTTLLEGSVRFTPKINDLAVSPKSIQIIQGQQVQLNADGQVLINNDVNLEKVVAWKNGYFLFSSSSLKDVMNQISRWYDVEVVFEGKPDNRKFGGKIQRDLILSKALKILEKNDINFKIEGKTIYVGS